MNRQLVTTRPDFSTGDAAVTGVLGGVAGGLAMAAALLLTGWLTGDGPAAVLGRFDPGSGRVPFTGLLAHLAMSAALGLGFGLLLALLWRRWAAPAWLAGVVYTVAIWALATGGGLAAAGSALLEMPAWQFLLGHVVYGALLGWLAGRGLR